MNNVTLYGRITKDVEVRTTGAGLKVTDFTLAVDRNVPKSDDNDERQTADFIPCVAWRNTAEFLEKYSQKGARMIVQGKIQTRTWEDEEGDTHYVTEVLADSVKLIDWKEEQKKPKYNNNKKR